MISLLLLLLAILNLASLVEAQPPPLVDINGVLDKSVFDENFEEADTKTLAHVHVVSFFRDLYCFPLFDPQFC